MLGLSLWFTAFAVPTVALGGFVASRKRLAYQWRDELMDRDNDAYPSFTENDVSFFSYVQPALLESDFLDQQQPSSSSSYRKNRGVSRIHREAPHVPVEGNKGLYVVPLLAPDEINLLLDDALDWASEWGVPTDPRVVQAFQQSRQQAREEENESLFGGDARARFAVEHEGRLVRQADAVAKMLLDTTSRIAQNSPTTNSNNSSSDVGRKGTEEQKEEEDSGTNFLEAVRTISDHAIDFQLMRAPWGTGDALLVEKMPLSLRVLTQKVRDVLPGVGRLRHVRIDVSPTGEHYVAPTCPKAFDGHEYIVIPLRRQPLLLTSATRNHQDDDNVVVTSSGNEGEGGREKGDDRKGATNDVVASLGPEGTILTTSPVLRSRTTTLREVLANSWTSRDIDVRVPNGALLRVVGEARYQWGWGMRPTTWFGHCSHHIPRAAPILPNERQWLHQVGEWLWNKQQLQLFSPAPGQPAGAAAAAAAATGGGHSDAMTSAETKTSDSSSSSSSLKSSTVSSYTSSSPPPAAATSPHGNKRASASSVAVAASGNGNRAVSKCSPVDASAIVTLHFEGPRKQGTQRSVVFHPERLIFGTPPEPSSFDLWQDDMPTEQQVADEWIIGFMIRNYLNLLRSS